MTRLLPFVLASLLCGCLIPVEVAAVDGGGSGGGSGGGAAGGTGGGGGGGGTGGGTAFVDAGHDAGLPDAGGVDAGADAGVDAGFCSLGGGGACNDDLQMSAPAGQCVNDACVCNAGFELNPTTGKCRLYYARYPIAGRPAHYALAMDPAQNRAGVAWIIDSGNDAGFDVYYRDWQYAAPGGQPAQKIATVQVAVGVSVAFRQGNPVVAFLGGGSDGTIAWPNSDAVFYERDAANVWHPQTVATTGTQAVCGNPVSDLGVVVGLWPALATDGAKVFLAWRDIHYGQFPQQDFAGSDLEIAESANGAAPFTYGCAKAGGNDKLAHGQGNRMVVANGAPAIVYTHGFGGVAGTSGVTFVRRGVAGWLAPVDLFANNPTLYPVAGQIGFAHAAGTGYAVASGNANLGRATLFTSSADGVTWVPEVLLGDQAGGPDVAIDSDGRYLVSVVDCQKGAGTACLAYGVSLWRSTLTPALGYGFVRGPLVDTDGATDATRLGVFPNGKRAVLYVANTGPLAELRLAIER